MNLVLHGVAEPEGARDHREKTEMDKEECGKIFTEMRAGVRKENIKFCKRLGEKKREPRPLVIGLTSAEVRRNILDRNRELQHTKYNNVSIVADLTGKQREEERDMQAEAEKRNKNLSEEERSKNLKWMVVGRKGEKRLIKGEERQPPPREYRRREDTGARPKEPTARGPRRADSVERRPEHRETYRRGTGGHQSHGRSQEQAEIIRQLEADLRRARAGTDTGRMERERGAGKRGRGSGTDSETEVVEPRNKTTRQ